MTTQKKQLFAFLSVIIIVLGLFVFLSPKVTAFLFPFRRKNLWNSFIKKTLTNKILSTREFWQLRDFYYPGYILFNKNVFPQETIDPIVKKIGVKIKNNNFFQPFLIFQSKKITSLEAFVKVYRIDDLININDIPKKSIIFQDESFVIYYTKQKEVKIIFIRPKEEMVLTNGYFDWKKRDTKLLKDKLWFVITSIRLD